MLMGKDPRDGLSIKSSLAMVEGHGIVLHHSRTKVHLTTAVLSKGLILQRAVRQLKDLGTQCCGDDICV